MAGRKPYNQGPEKQWMSVIGVNPGKKEIQGTLRDGGKVAVSLFEIPPVFRWPIEGEIWTIEKDKLDSTHWILGSRVHHQQLEEESAVGSFNPGEMRLDATNIYNREGRSLLYGRITRGRVSSTGTIAYAGTGDWSVIKNSTGVYTITFNPAFGGEPTVVGTSNDPIVPNVRTDVPLPGVVVVRVFNSANTPIDTAFAFLAVGEN